MTEYVLAFKPAIGIYGGHDPSAAIFADGKLVFGVEEERYTRVKHATRTFPENAIRACLDFAGIPLSEVNKVVLPYKPELVNKRIKSDLKRAANGGHPADRAWSVVYHLRKHAQARLLPDLEVKEKLSAIGSPVPDIQHRSHHRCHAATAFHPTDFTDALVLTIDGRGEYDSTVVWHGSGDELRREQTYNHPNSLGHFYGMVTEYLGYRAFNGEGKIMGLAPYGELQRDIENRLRSSVDFGVDYDVTNVTSGGVDAGVDKLATILGRQPSDSNGEFDQFEKDLAHTVQYLLEETVVDIVDYHLDRVATSSVGLAGGVALNCKMNKRIMEMDATDEVFIQPVANDAGLAIGAGWLESRPSDVEPMSTVYWGPSVDSESVEKLLETNKLPYRKMDDPVPYVAQQIAEGSLVGWMQGRQEMGPRALGNRSILADPRTKASLDRVNEFVKHREGWRPFAPSMTLAAADKYLEGAVEAPYMIKTFDTDSELRDEIEAVVHPADKTTRPQTVTSEQNPRYHRLLEEFGEITDVPVLLNTSFNDHGEPVVTKPKEAIRDFYGMGLDVMVIEDYVLEKSAL